MESKPMKHTTILGRIKEKPTFLKIERGYQICVAKVVVEHISYHAELNETLVTLVAIGESASALQKKPEEGWILATGYYVASRCVSEDRSTVFQPLVLVNHCVDEKPQAESVDMQARILGGLENAG